MSSKPIKATLPPSTLSAEDFRARTLAAPAKVKVWLEEIEAVYGSNSPASLKSYVPDLSLSKMSPAERVRGLTPCSQGWESKAMRAYRSRLQRLIAERHTYADAFSLSPTLTSIR